MRGMAAQWERWLKYAKAKIDDSVTRGERRLDELEAEQAARAEAEPWLSGDADAPSFEEAKARIEAQAEAAGRATSSGPGPASTGASAPRPDQGTPAPTAVPAGDTIDLAAQQKAAAERLAAMRAELGLDDPPPPEDAPPKDA